MSRARGRWLLLVTPISAVLVVLLGVLAGGSRPVRSARVYSGPTQGITDLFLRVELGARDRIAEVPVTDTPFTVAALVGGKRVASARGRTDALGNSEVLLSLPQATDAAFELVVEPHEHDQPPLARGLVLGSSEKFRAAAKRRGGYKTGRLGAIGGRGQIGVAPTRGVLITGQGAMTDELRLYAFNGDERMDASFTLKLEGAEPAEVKTRTSDPGGARARFRPIDATLRVDITAQELLTSGEVLSDPKYSFSAQFDVVQGAIRATKQGDRLLLESSGAASAAYVAFFDQNQRYGGARVLLTQTPDGHLVGELPWPSHLVATPLWAVTSSQPDLASPSAVGWRVVGNKDEIETTFDARELLLLDGAPAAQSREARRAKRIRLVTAAYASLALLLTLYLFVRHVRAADARFEQHLTTSGIEGVPSIAPPRKGRAVLAAACIGLGFVVLVVFALLKD